MRDYKQFAVRKIEEIYKMEDLEELYALIVTKDETFALYPKPAFQFHFTCMRLALSCIAWVNACRQSGMEDESSQKIFLRAVMERFKTPETIEIAKTFSEYLYSGDENNPAGETISMVTRLFQKLEEAQGPGKKQINKKTVECFKTLIYIAEGIRESFENEFLAFE